MSITWNALVDTKALLANMLVQNAKPKFCSQQIRHLIVVVDPAFDGYVTYVRNVRADSNRRFRPSSLGEKASRRNDEGVVVQIDACTIVGVHHAYL